MKQNLIQKQLKLDQQKRTSLHQPSNDSFTQYDLTSKAFYIYREILESKYAFTKKSLANFLHGKPILLQQNNKEQAPSVLKGYMNLYDFQQTEEMIEVMIRVNVLKEERFLVQKKSSLRLFATNKYDWNLFPKVIIKIKSKAVSDQPIIKRKNGANSEMIKSRFTIFLKKKNNLPINEEKRQQQMYIKAEKERKEEQERKRLQGQEWRQEKQNEIRQKQQKQRQQKERAQKQEQNKNYESQMNSFWIKERQKIQQFICPKNDISLLDSPNIRKSKKQKLQAEQKITIQTVGHVLQIQMKELKENEKERKNPMKPIVSWSFMKNNIDNKQSSGSDKSMNESVKSQGIILHKEQSKWKNPSSFSAKVQQNNQQFDSFSESTQVTQTNHKLKSHQTECKVQTQKQSFIISNQKPIRPFAQNAQQSMFSCNFYCNRRSTESIPQDNKQKLIQIGSNRNKTNRNQLFSFKREKPLQNYQQTVTIVKRPPSKTSSFDKFRKVFKKSSQQEKKIKQPAGCTLQRDSKTEIDQFHPFSLLYSQTKTIAMVKEKPQNRCSFQDTRKIMNFDQQKSCLEMDLSSQTVSMVEPIKKNKKKSTKDLRNFSQIQPVVKRDSFAQELIDNYMKRT